MPSTYTTGGRYTKQGTGENSNTWGTILNENTIDLIDTSIFLTASIDVTGSGDYTLTTANGSVDEARHAALKFTGTPTANRNIITPTTSKIYVVQNACSAAYSMVIKSGAGTTVSFSQNELGIVYVNGSNVVLLAKVNSSGDVTNIGALSVETGDLQANAVTNAKLATMATQTLKGRNTAGTGDPEDLTATQVTNILNAFTGDSGSGGVKGLVPAPSSGDSAANKYLKADGTWQTISVFADSTKVYQTTGTSIANGNWTTLSFDTEAWDDDGWHDNVTNNSRVTVGDTGRYIVIATYDANSNNNAQYGIRVMKNGATEMAKFWTGVSSTPSDNHQYTLVCEISLSASDYIEVQAYQNGGSAIASGTTEAGTSLTVRRVK